MKRTVVVKRVLRDPVTKRMIGVEETTDTYGEREIVCRGSDGNLYPLPPVTSLVEIEKSAVAHTHDARLVRHGVGVDVYECTTCGRRLLQRTAK